MTEADLLPGTKHNFWKMEKRSILYVGINKAGPCPKGWRVKVVQVLHCKAGGEPDGSNNVMLLKRMDEEWTTIELKTWASKNISG